MYWLKIFQFVISILLIITVLLQNRGTGLGSAFGGGGGGVYLTKRGLEKKLYNATIVLAALFFIVSVLAVLL